MTSSLHDPILQDLRFAARQLRRAPAFTATILLTLALAVGATTAMVSVLRSTLLNPTPYPRAAQLVAISDVNLKGIKANGITTVARAADLAGALAESRTGKPTPLFRNTAFFYYDQPSLVLNGHTPISVDAAATSGDFFRVLGTTPLLGRPFTPADDAHGAPEVAVISYGLWQRAFAADPSVIGRSVLLAGKSTTIVGVMPQHFAYPAVMELWKPAHLSQQDFGGYRGNAVRFVSVIARLNESITPALAQQSLNALAHRLGQSYTETDAEWGFGVASLRAQIFGSYRAGLLVLSAAVVLLLLIACANIAGLQLSRNNKRQGEIALRRALGISGSRLLQQLVTESLLLLVLGSLLGVALSFALLRIFVAQLPATLVSFDQPHLDLFTLSIALAVAVGAGLLCGIVPALQFGRTEARSALSLGHSRTVAAGTRRFGRSFATLQIALALVMLTLAASLLQNLHRLLQTRLGYQPSHLLTASIHLPFGSEPAQTHRFYQQFQQRIAALPGVEAVGAISALPLSNFFTQRTADIQGQPPTPHHDAVTADGRFITPAYLEAMGIPLLAGRALTDRDAEPGAPAVILVNQTLASRYFPKQNPIGKRLLEAAAAGRPAPPSAEIVGVIGDVHGTGGSLEAAVRPEIDQPEQGKWPDMHFAIRTPLSAAALEPALRQQLASLNPGVALGTVSLFSSTLDRALAQPRLNSGLLTALAGLALLLVLIGVYGVIAFSVAQRTREVGVRMALGSSRPAIFRMLLTEALGILAAGLLLGVAGATLTSHLLSALIATNPASLTATLLPSCTLIALAVLAASSFPARRAASLDPITVLRSE